MKNKIFNVSRLDYFKMILCKISFNKALFKKEYRKSAAYLDPAERSELKKWLRQAPVPN